MNLQELFESGAHHTVESVLGQAGATFGDVLNAIQRRFGEPGISDTQALSNLFQSVANAIKAAQNLPNLTEPLPESYGQNPFASGDYEYVTVARLPIPGQVDKFIEIPWTIRSSIPLDLDSVIELAERELNQGFERDNRYGNARYADLHRRDLAFQRMVRNSYGGEAPIDVNVLAIYRR